MNRSVPPDLLARAQPRGRIRAWARRLALSSLAALFLLGALELLLRIDPLLVGERRCNFVFSTYDTRPGGIYVREKRSRMRFMWPELATGNYWNGYRWHHATDARGFRNPPATPADVLLLGDSLIYGHGVEEDATVAHLLRSEHGVDAYNMGRQGAALYDEYVLLRTFLPELAPRAIVLFVFLNDFDDLEVYRSADEIAAIPELDRLDYAALREWTRQLPARRPSALRSWLWRRPSLRLLLAVAKDLPGLSFTAPAFASASAADPPFLAPLLDDARRARLASYYQRIFADLAARCRERGIALRVVYLGAGADPKAYAAAQESAVALVGDAARASGLPFFDSREVFAGCVACFLPGDGHFSATGHRRLARFVVETVLPKGPPL
jgi:hypothetical protein